MSWLAFGTLLVLCILTRHINVVLAAVLPGAFLLEGIAGSVRPKAARSRRNSWSRFFRSLAVGMAAVLLSSGILRLICMADGIEYRSRVGYTFQFRLDFLNRLSASARHEFLVDVGGRIADASLKKVILSLDRDNLPATNSGNGFIHEELMADAERDGVRRRPACWQLSIDS